MHFLSTTDWSPETLDAFLEDAARMKAGRANGGLAGKTMGMLFFNQSLRTRTSFEVGIMQLGGSAVDLAVGGGIWGIETADGVIMDRDAAEHVKEAAPVLSRYFDVLGVRAFPGGRDWEADRTDPVLSAFARSATVPVVNMESAIWHPCQALADALTWKELGLVRGDRLVLTWAYHPKALPMSVPNSVMVAGAQRGLEVVVLGPGEFALDPDKVRLAREIASRTGGSVTQTDDPAALEGAKVVYAKSWGSLAEYGRPEAEKSIRDGYRGWQVTPGWMERTGGARFMHCLPVRRNVVVADEVLDSAASVVVDQAENRLHVQKALLVRLLGG